jgi:excisionase family DNA binding protein
MSPVSPDDLPETVLIDVQAVAKMLACSSRHVYRLCDSGRMPSPVRLGALVRWSRKSITDWLLAGCPSCRKGGK